MFQLIEGLVRDQTAERYKVSGATFRMWILLNPKKEKKLYQKYVTSRLDDNMYTCTYESPYKRWKVLALTG